MNNHKNLDMTQGSIVKLVLLFALPICVGNILQQLYTTVDTLIVGNYCGSLSLAAVGTSSQPVELLLCIFLGLGAGVSILVSQFTGKGNAQGLKDLIATATSFLYLFAIPATIIGLLIGPMILKLMQVPDDTLSLATTYIRIIILGILGNMGYNMNAGILRGVGDSRSSLFFLLISCITNIILDLLFVAVIHMDVAGAALATVVSMYCSWFCSIIYIKKKYPELDFTLFPRRLDGDILRQIIKIGLPLGLNNSIYTFGHIAMQSVINAQGSAFIAGCSIASRISGIANVAITSLASSATTFAGQNFGAENYIRLKKGSKIIPFVSGLITCMGGILVTIFCRPILGLFTDDPVVLALAAKYTYIVLPFTWMYAVLNTIINYANGLGEVKYPTIVSLMMLWAVRIPAAYVIAYFIEGTLCMACIPLSFFFGMIAMFFYFRTNHWKSILKLAARETEA